MAIDLSSPGVHQEALGEAIQALYSGTTFPVSPDTGTRYFRTDRGIEYFYDGTRWLSTQVLSMEMSIANVAVTTEAFLSIPYRGVYGVYLERFEAVMFRLAAGEWDAVLSWTNAANARTTITTLDGAGTTSSNWTHHSAAIGAVLDTNAFNVVATLTEVSGTTNAYMASKLFYRLIG
jgi:hypothetical protein